MNLTELSDCYKGKKVFLTGHTGFKGSWLLNILHFIGANVKSYSLGATEKSLYNYVDGDKLCESIISDIRDESKIIQNIVEFEPDFIFHLAAQPLVRLSYTKPSETFAVNSIGTAHILDAVRLLEKPCNVILITTDKVYENKEWEYPYRENDRLGGYDPYSASKACAELVVSSYRNSFFNVSNYETHKKSIATARAGNVIGGGDWAIDRIIPDTINSLVTNKSIQIRNPYSVRPWQHVLESLSGYLALGIKMTENPVLFSDCFNFGPNADDNLTVETLVKQAIEIWGKGNYINAKLEGQLHEAGLLKLDINKTVNMIGWKPKFNSKKAIEMTINWYKNFDEKNAKNLVNQDIFNYFNE
jgi:CDP-glucose 4,6-dehydratase